MRLLLDTHLILWWEADDPRLSETVRRLVRDEADSVHVSRASLWEIAIKRSLGRLQLNLERFVRQVGKDGFEWLDIRNAHLLAVAGLPVFDDHRDPFDRLLVAQSLTEPLLLVTVDATLARYGSTVRVVKRGKRVRDHR
jgi:PIN domain nuclease of toxin-antitoxin system